MTDKDEKQSDYWLKDKLITELPGILNLSLNAYAEAQIMDFTVSESCIVNRDNWRLEADQIAPFCRG